MKLDSYSLKNSYSCHYVYFKFIAFVFDSQAKKIFVCVP